ncbi:EpsG family protein [Idiomarina seosinensis]|uniref:EpsG family protein n=1 Tax=Idiomarina seosinensis TaxID=281739 RepID=UPI0038500E68
MLLRRQPLFLFLYLLPFVLIGIFKSLDFGVDTPRYLDEFLFYADGGSIFMRTFEPGFGFISMIIGKYASLPFLFFLFFHNTFFATSILMLSRMVNYETIFFVNSLMSLSFFSFSNSGIRQTLAISILCIAMYWLISCRKVAVYWILVAIAALFHNSAIISGTILFGIFLISVPMTKAKPSFIFIIFLSVCGFAIASSTLLSFLYESYSNPLNDDLVLNFKLPVVFSVVSIAGLMLAFTNRQRVIKNFRLCYEVDNGSINVFRFVVVLLITVPALYWVSTEIRLVDRVALYLVPAYWLIISMVFSASLSRRSMYLVNIISVVFLSFVVMRVIL